MLQIPSLSVFSRGLKVDAGIALVPILEESLAGVVCSLYRFMQ